MTWLLSKTGVQEVHQLPCWYEAAKQVTCMTCLTSSTPGFVLSATKAFLYTAFGSMVYNLLKYSIVKATMAAASACNTVHKNCDISHAHKLSLVYYSHLLSQVLPGSQIQPLSLKG